MTHTWKYDLRNLDENQSKEFLQSIAAHVHFPNIHLYSHVGTIYFLAALPNKKQNPQIFFLIVQTHFCFTSRGILGSCDLTLIFFPEPHDDGFNPTVLLYLAPTEAH